MGAARRGHNQQRHRPGAEAVSRPFSTVRKAPELYEWWAERSPVYRDSGTPEQLTWASGGNLQAMLSRKTSCTTNAISLLRAAEKREPEVASKILLQPPLIGRNGMGVTALPHVTNCFVVWKFAKNQAGAKQFLSDLIDNSRTGYEKSKGLQFSHLSFTAEAP